MAGKVDALYFFLVAVSAFFVILIAALVIFFGIRYRRRAHDEVGTKVVPSLALELAWTIIPLCLGLVMFGWGASVYFNEARPPAETLDIYVVGKQWMWKFQHLDGQREINELHVPVGRAVRLTGTSEDVIHSFFVPAFRLKADVIPGRYTTLWFNATKTGRYHLFCAEYCGTKHSGMTGTVIVMDPTEYQAWLAGGAGEESLASKGQKAFQDLACITCHRADGQGRGPVLDGVYGSKVSLNNGQIVIADEAYIRESILSPAAKVTTGFQPIMPTFQGLVSEEQLLALIEYVKSLKGRPANQPATAGPGDPAPGEATPARGPQTPPDRQQQNPKK
jgi:cytochrome c oxidase subunit 2